MREDSIRVTINDVHLDEHMMDFDPASQRLKIDLTALGLPPLSKRVTC